MVYLVEFDMEMGEHSTLDVANRSDLANDCSRGSLRLIPLSTRRSSSHRPMPANT